MQNTLIFQNWTKVKQILRSFCWPPSTLGGNKIYNRKAPKKTHTAYRQKWWVTFIWHLQEPLSHALKLAAHSSELMLMPQEVWDSAVTESADCWQISHTMCLSSQCLSTITLCGLWLHGWVSVFLKHFHFAMMPLSLDCRISSRREDISWTDSTIEFSELFGKSIPS